MRQAASSMCYAAKPTTLPSLRIATCSTRSASPAAMSRSGSPMPPTFLMADVEIVATYELYNINRAKLENLIHRIFGPARLDIEIKDRFGQPVVPREWFLVPLFVIDEAVEKIRDGTISNFRYNPKSASLVDDVRS
jgi:hypothetical protein